MHEPTLIINFESLQKHETHFKAFRNGLITESNKSIGEEGKTALEYISDVFYDYNKVVIKKTKFVLCKPTFSSFNKLVRTKLTELKVDFVVDEN